MNVGPNEMSLPVTGLADGPFLAVTDEDTAPEPAPTTPPEPEIDRAEAARFLHAVTGDDNPAVTFQTFDDSKTQKRGSLAAVLHGTLDDHFDELAKRNRLGAGVFVMVNAGPCSGPRRAESVRAVRAAFLDLDGSPIEPVRAALVAAGMAAHCEVESSPDRWHVYLRVTGCPLPQFKAMQQALAKPFGGDMAVCDLPRVMRLPGFVHRKAEPHRSRIVSTRNHAPYDAKELVQKLGLKPPEQRPPAQSPASSQIKQPTGPSSDTTIPEGQRHTRLVSMAGSMRRAGMSVASIEVAILQMASECGLEEEEARRIASDIGAKPAPPEGVLTAAAKIAELAALSRLEYEVQRADAAKQLKMRNSVLDDLVKAQRPPDPAADSAAQGSGEAPIFPVDELWPEQVAVGDVLDEARSFFKRHVIATDASYVAITLWSAFTWTIDHAECAPMLALLSPEKRCGKSTAMRAIGRLVRRPLTASNVSAASIFRAIDAWQPTLLLDEGDTFVRDNEELRGVVNSGHTRDTAYVLRVETVDEKLVPRRFSTWGAKVIAMIGKPPGTILDRSVPVWMRRKMVQEKVQRLPRANVLTELRQKLARFAVDHGADLSVVEPAVPEGLNDRAADCWAPLLAIADLAGESWGTAARTAAVALSGDDAAPDDGYGVQLLADVRTIFDTRGQNRIRSVELLAALNEDGERPWATLRNGRPMDARRLAQMLGSFGIKSSAHRFGTPDVQAGAGAVFVPDVAKGYVAADFQDAWTRYLKPATGAGEGAAVTA